MYTKMCFQARSCGFHGTYGANPAFSFTQANIYAAYNNLRKSLDLSLVDFESKIRQDNLKSHWV